MKRYTILLLLAFVANMCWGQSAYYDAIALKARLDAAQVDSSQVPFKVDSDPVVLEILARHSGAAGTVRSGDLKGMYEGNPFIANRISLRSGDESDARFLFEISRQSIPLSAQSKEITSVLGMSVSTLADGVAQFLVKRTKEELNAYFFKRFHDAIKDSPELTALFPATKLILGKVQDEIYNFRPFLETLREAFITDMKGLPQRMETLILDPRFGPSPPSRERIIAADLFHVTSMVLDNGKPTDLLEYLGTEASNFQNHAGFDANVKGYFQFAHLLSSSLRSNDPERIWITPEEFKVLMSDKIVCELFLGLVYQRGKEIQIGEGKKLGDVLQLADAKEFCGELGNFYASVEGAYRGLLRIKAKEKAFEEVAFEDYFDFVQSTLGILEKAHALTGVLVTLPSPRPAYVEDFFKYKNMLESALQLILEVRQKHYSSAAAHAGILIAETLGDSKLTCKFITASSFIAAIAKAENADQVANVIETFALPAGSSQVKRHATFNLALNAYVGGAFGEEILTDADGMNESRKGFVAMHAPIGLTASTSKEGVSLSGFFTIIDLGALTAYRFDDSETEDLPEFSLQNIIAPGAYAVLGIPKMPISLGFGGQLGPQLRKIDAVGATVSDRKGWRWGGFIAVDIPLMNFYSSGGSFGCK